MDTQKFTKEKDYTGRIMMLRKILSVMMCASLPMACWSWGSGFYVGGGMGADTTDYYIKSYIKQDPSQQKFSVINILDGGAAQGIFGTLFGGYSIIRQAFYFAGEANYNGSTAAYTTTNNEFDHSTFQSSDTRMKMIPNWGLSLIPGWFMFQDSALIYGRVGYAGSVFRVDTSDTSLADITHTISGFRYGAGIEKRVYKNLGLRFEYNHIIYASSTIYHVDASNGAITPKQTVIIPQTNQFEFGLVYRFC